MKLLLDQGLPRSSGQLLRMRGRDAVHVSEIGMSTAEDGEILTEARNQQRIAVTLDADFHAILAFDQAVAPSVIRIRVEGLRAEAAADLIDRVIASCAEDLRLGCVISVHADGRCRVRRLPLF